MASESTARGSGWFRERFVETAAGPHLSEAGTSGNLPDTWLTLLRALPSQDENYPGKLARLGRRPGNLLMRVDSRGLHDTTYVFGKTLWKMRVQTLNSSNSPRLE